MHEILFRGKRTINEDWVEGNLFIPDKHNTPTQILIGTDIYRIPYDVISTTVGQYTGLTDKNGKKIFEGDILKATEESGKTFIYKVVFINGVFGLIVKNGGFACSLALWAKECIEIIGNIHDNPELMGGAG